MKDIPVILLTALGEPEDIFRGLEVKADNYLTKPLDEELLFSRVQQVLANRQMPSSRVTRKGVTVILGRREHNVDADRTQIINLLVSSLDNASHRHNKMKTRVEELESEQRQLNKRIEERERENRDLKGSGDAD